MDYLSTLPDEIKLLIFSYLDSYGIINLEDISVKFKHISFDRELVGKLCFYKDYRLKTSHLKNSILHKLRKETITSLNINCVYWISKNEITKCLRLPLLECLYAVDTKLCLETFSSSDLQYLHTLAITITDLNCKNLNVTNNFKKLKKLCILYDISLHYQFCLPTFVEKCTGLEELWLLDLSYSMSIIITFGSVFNKFSKTAKKLVLSYDGPYGFFDFNYLGFNCMSFKKISNKVQMCVEKTDKPVNHIYTDDFYKETFWEFYISCLKYESPLGVDDAKKLVYGKNSLENVSYKELSLHHTPSLCCQVFKSSVSSILSLPNMRNLCKLSINMCFCELKSIKDDKTEPLFKRVRRTDKNIVCKSHIENIVEHSPLIEELEIWECDLISKTENYNALNCIKKLQQLKKLTLAGVTIVGNASYLLDISQNCLNLKSLRISSSGHNSSLNNYLCLSLPYLNTLQDFRYEQNYIPLDRIIESLLKIKSCKIQRIVFKCQEIERFTIDPFKEFIANNPQLRFLLFFITKMPKSAIQRVCKDLRQLKSPEQIFIVSNDISNIKSFVPYIHLFEMIDYNTHVGVLDVFNGFV